MNESQEQWMRKLAPISPFAVLAAAVVVAIYHILVFW